MKPDFGACGATLAVLALLATLGFGWRRRRYGMLLRMDPRRDDAFRCRLAHPVTISLHSDGFELPSGLRVSGQTAFLAFDVRATLLGTFADPFIEVSFGPITYRQYFERGANGRRYLNLSPIFQAVHQRPPAAAAGLAVRVCLRGKSISWTRAGTLELFDSPSIERATKLVVAPHPDDAEIAAFGIYSEQVSWVATVTAGELGLPATSAPISSGRDAVRWAARIRVWDSLTIPQLGGVPTERCVSLVYPDGRLKEMHDRSGTSASLWEGAPPRASLRSRNRLPEFQHGDSGCRWKDLVDEIRLLLEKSNPEIVVCPHPLMDPHDDHVFTTVAIEEAARDEKQKERLFFLYAVHHPHAPLYPFGPASSCVSLAPSRDTEWVADSIYSHALTPDQRTAKYFAIDAMHGLRTYFDGEPKTVHQGLRALRRELGALLCGTGLPASSFLRRGPRPNEIYYVVSRESLSALVKRALDRYPCDVS